MNEQEEHQLINAILSAGHPDISATVVEVLNKRDARFSDAFAKVSENTRLLREIGSSLERHVAEEHELLKNFIAAFPEGDARAHRDAHKVWMDREKKREALRDAIIQKSLAGLLWMAIAGIGIAVWHYVGDQIRTP